MHRTCLLMILYIALFSLFSGVSLLRPSSAILAEAGDSIPTADLPADALIQWMQLLFDRVDGQAVNIPTAARLYAYAGIAAYESVWHGMSDAVSLGERLNAMPVMPTPADGQVYDWASVVNGALHRVSLELLEPARNLATLDSSFSLNTIESNVTRQSIEGLYRLQIRQRADSVPMEIITASLDYGAQIGDAVVAYADTDGFSETRQMPYVVPVGEGLWIPTTTGQGPMEPHWGRLRPFVLASADACHVPLDVPFDTNPNSTFHVQAMEIRDMAARLTEEQREIATFWDERVGESGTAPGHWLIVQNLLAEYLDLHLADAATMFALVNITMADAFISAWWTKYEINLLRPETYINTYIDPTWEPLRQAPPFPAYPSGHAVLGGAVAEVLTALYGPLAYLDRYGVRYGLPARSYTSFEAAAYENALSRLYGGVHYRVDMENGLRQGRCVGQSAVSRLLR